MLVTPINDGDIEVHSGSQPSIEELADAYQLAILMCDGLVGHGLMVAQQLTVANMQRYAASWDENESMSALCGAQVRFIRLLHLKDNALVAFVAWTPDDEYDLQ